MELWTDAKHDRSVVLDTAVKLSGLGSHAADDRMLFPREWSATGFARVRLGLGLHWGKGLDAQLAYEQRARRISHADADSAGAGILPGEARAPFRLTQLDDEVVDASRRFSYRHELDRALVALHPRWGEVVIGRQAIGLGRGVLFGAVDLFNPFTPTEVDREWRRGVDALRCEKRISDTASVEALAVFGESWGESAWLVRWRGAFGRFDAEVLGGKRAWDGFGGLVFSTAVGEAEVHGEVAVFDTPEGHADGGLFGCEHMTAKGVLGASYTFGVGNGLTVQSEVLYSGFGVANIEDLVVRARDPAFQTRWQRGDMQILRHYAWGLQLSYPFHAAVSGSLLALTSLQDGSGLVSPSCRWDLSDTTSVTGSLFVPWGEGPEDGRLRSEYGGSALSGFLQLAMYF